MVIETMREEKLPAPTAPRDQTRISLLELPPQHRTVMYQHSLYTAPDGRQGPADTGGTTADNRKLCFNPIHGLTLFSTHTSFKFCLKPVQIYPDFEKPISENAHHA